MATNLAVKALLSWVNSLKLCDAEITTDELQDGVIFLKLVYMIKKEPNSCLNDSTEDRFRAVAEFIEGECRFSATKGTSIYWENIREGINLTVEIAKVLLLLVYHDMMNDRCTLNMLDCDVEQELAHLSGSFVLESEGHVYLRSGLDAYLRRKYLPVSQDIFARSATTSTSNASTVSSLSDDESPIFHRANTIKFVDVETVASSSVSSPLGDVMNTPKFQLKKMQREIIKERDYRDCLEKELASKIALIAQRESQMSQLKYRLDKLQEEQDDQEHVARAQINELQIKNNTVQRRLDEMLMQNKDLKNNTSLMEHKVDKLTEENGLLSSQVRTACSQLAILETEVGRLTEDHASAQEEWRKETSHLRSELNQATAQKELLSEQIEILQGKISSLEDEISRATKEDVGENLGAVMEMAQLKTEVSTRCKHIEVLEEEVSRLRLEIQNKNTEVEKMRFDCCKESKALQNKVQKKLDDARELLTKAEEKIQTQLIMLTKQEQEDQKELLQQQLSASEEEMMMENEVQVKEEQMVLLKTDSSEQQQEIHSLKKRIETLVSSLSKAEEDMQSKEDLLCQQKQVNALQQEALQHLDEKTKQVEILKKQISADEEIRKLKEFQSEKRRLLFEAEEKLKTLQTEMSAVKTLIAEKDQTINALREEVTAQAKLLLKTKDEAEASEKRVVEIKEEASKQTHILNHVIQNLRKSFHLLFQKLLAKEQKLLEAQQESSQQINLLQEQLASANAGLNQHKETQAANVRVKECVQEFQATTLKEKEVLVQEKEALLARIVQAEKDHEALQEQVEALVSQKERLVQANQATERENVALRKLESALQQELEMLKMENEKLLKEKGEEMELIKRDLQEQLATKSETAHHYKAQMEKAVIHYNSKKLLLQKSQEEVDALKGSLEVKEREMQAIIMEKRLLQLALDKAQSSEKTLSNRVASLEAQLALDDQSSKVQIKTQCNGGSATGWCFFEVPNTNSDVCSRAQEKRAMSVDSLDQSSLEDSLNSKRACTEGKMEADSTQNNPTSSAKRCRTTQKSSDCSEGDQPLYSLASDRSQPNPSSADSAQPAFTELFDMPAKSCASDQLIGLPGYRHSAIYAQPTKTFCVGAENEPDGAPEDWLRIAELQTRNKACLPHLKSSYPLETETGRNGPFIFTDEELRTGDPSDTIRRAAKMPGQLQVSHQPSLMLGQAGAAGTRSHHLSLLPGQLPSKTINSHQLRSQKSTKQSSSMLCVQQTSHEKKMTKPSCLPRPLTPKNNNLSSGSSSATLHPALSPVEWRQSVMFMVENTPKSSNSLKKRLSKLRGSTRKSPCSSLKKSPTQTGAHIFEEKMPSGSSRGVGQAGNVRSYRSPQVTTKILKKFPQATSRSGKLPGLTTSARKIMERFNV